MFGIWLFGFFRNGGHPRMVERIASANRGTQFLYRASLNKWWFDDLNHLLFIVHRRPGRRGRCGGSTGSSSTAP